MIIVPIRTESLTHRTPLANHMLIGVNVLCFLLFSGPLGGGALEAFQDNYLAFQSDEPAFYQFFTYQFLHAGLGHLLGNLLFLWVFGNSVNGKLGDLPYLLFYLAGGAFAVWGYAVVEVEPFQLKGASGAVAAVTTAYLALFPRSRVTVLLWLFLFVHFFEVPALLLIGVKIIVWDNIVAPSFGGPSRVAYGAHLSGYLFGFAVALSMLWVRAVARDQFDILALWKRWYQRREFAAAMTEPGAAARGRFGRAARVKTMNPRQLAKEEEHLDKMAGMRTKIAEALTEGDVPRAASEYERLTAIDAQQCLSQRHQLQVAREFYGSGRFPEAAAAFDRFVEVYPHSGEAANVALLLGIIYARDLRRYEMADKHLTRSMAALRDQPRREQCAQWLRDVRATLGRSAPEP